MIERYHTSFGFPNGVLDALHEVVNNINELYLSVHSIVSMLGDKKSIVPVPNVEVLLEPENNLMEVYVDDGKIEKFLIRVKTIDAEFDYTYVITKDGMIVTCWANDKEDVPTLNKRSTSYVKCLEI